jgi:thymidylate synthase (FAD)
MQIIEPSVSIEIPINGEQILKNIEKIGRVCYKSEDKITSDSSKRFIQNLMNSGHESVIEHISVSFRVICDRGVSHEIVRHRIASYSQESTRYCDYSADKFDKQLTFIKPLFFDSEDCKYKLWHNSMENAEIVYRELIQNGASPQEARSVLPNSLKTEIVMTMNLREWRHFIKLRTSKAAHPQMRQVALLILKKLKNNVPILFDEFKEDL